MTPFVATFPVPTISTNQRANGLSWADPQGKYEVINPNGNSYHSDEPIMWFWYTSADKAETLSSQRAEFEKLMRFGRAEAQAIGDILRTHHFLRKPLRL